jgi:hypothetical protein
VSSAFVLRCLVGVAGTEGDDLCGAGIADFAVSGLVTDLRSEPDLAEEEPTAAVWPLARQIKTPAVPNNQKIQRVIVEYLAWEFLPAWALPIRAQFSSWPPAQK